MVTATLHGYRESGEFSREQRLYRPNRENELNWGALPPVPPFRWGLRPHTPFSNITFLN